ncbi:nitroreductase family protein [Candidatus Riflebacteria bacterium]
MQTIEAIKTRRSIRNYRDEKVSDAKIMELLEAAMYAPSAGNQQPWHFIVVTKKELLVEIAEVHPYGKMAAMAPLAILVCCDKDLDKHTGFWVQDCSAATQNLLLAAHALELGAVWVGVYPREDRINSMQKIFNLPERIIPLNVVVIGYPAKGTQTAQRFKEERVHSNSW